jgi:hypothetical protein
MMRTVIIKKSQLVNDDWRAERYTIPPTESFVKAREAGWDSGTRGSKQPSSSWAKHPRVELRKEFWSAYRAGRKARADFMKARDDYLERQH